MDLPNINLTSNDFLEGLYSGDSPFNDLFNTSSPSSTTSTLQKQQDEQQQPNSPRIVQPQPSHFGQQSSEHNAYPPQQQQTHPVQLEPKIEPDQYGNRSNPSTSSHQVQLVSRDRVQQQVGQNAPMTQQQEVANPPTLIDTSKMLKPKSTDPEKRARYERTLNVLNRSGLLDITMKTAELMKQNNQLNKELQQLRSDTEMFVASVLSNPENRGLVEMQQQSKQQSTEDGTRQRLSNQQQTRSPGQVFLSPNLDFHIINSVGEIQQLSPTIVKNSAVAVASSFQSTDAAKRKSQDPNLSDTKRNKVVFTSA